MKKLFLLYFVVWITSSVFIWGLFVFSIKNLSNDPNLKAYLYLAGIKTDYQINSSFINNIFSSENDVNLTLQNNNKYFSTIPFSVNNLTDQMPLPKTVNSVFEYYTETQLSNIFHDSDMIFTNSFLELPLHPTDYYAGKYENAVAGVVQLNTMPIMRSGDSFGIIKDKFIQISPSNGYVHARGYGFGSGVCWTVSVLGAMMDKANIDFRNKYGIDLFVYKPGDRAGHSSKYLTYTNGYRGYTILQYKIGVPARDYRFSINPQISQIPELADLKVKIVMLQSSKHPNASKNISIASYIISNKKF